jgi:ceramide glucosyltransferase
LPSPLEIIGYVFLILALAGCGYQVLAGFRIRAFAARPAPVRDAWPAVSVLKPLHGAEPGLEPALASVLDQDYPAAVQWVFGVQDPADGAIGVVERLRQARPGLDIALVADPTPHGSNLKVANLINMAGQARHGVVVLADSDIAVKRDYLRQVAGALGEPAVGVVTCPYRGEGVAGFWSRLAAMGLTYQFLPSVAVGVSLGLATPCMGSTIALTRETLGRIGGFEAFADQLADDYEIGAAVRALGLKSLVAPVIVAHQSAEGSLAELWRHELRWARTIRGVDPAGYAGSGVMHAIPLALIGVILLGAAPASLAVLAAALICRVWTMSQVDRAAGLPRGGWPRGGWPLAPLRDILSLALFAASFLVRDVDWRGVRYRVDRQGGLERI